MPPIITIVLLLQAATQPTARVVLPDESAFARGPGDGAGHVVVEPDTVACAAPVTLTFTFSVGDPGIASGGGIACLVSAFWGWTPPQIEQPGAPGFVTVTCDTDAMLATEVHAASRAIYLRVTDGRLGPGTRVTFRYGDTQDGANPTARGRSDSYAEREERFFFRVDGDGDGFYVPLAKQPIFEVAPAPAGRLVCNGPGHAFVDQPFEVSVAALDPAGNRVRTFRGPLTLTTSGSAVDAPATIDFAAEHGGARRVTITPREPGLVLIEASDPAGQRPAATSNAILVREPGESVKLYWADLHGHSNVSDGTGTPEDFLAYARDVARVDVVALTDHDHWGYAPLKDAPEVWQRILTATAAANEPGRFVALPGYEWTNWTWGHMHVLFPDESRAKIVAWNEPGGESLDDLWKSLAGCGALTIPHHTGGSTMPFRWPDAVDPGIVPVAEVCSVHGVSESIEHPRRVSRPIAGGMIATALDKGLRLGLIGSGDTHDGHPGLRATAGGLAGIYARALTREAIFEALRARRVYATTGCRSVLRFQVAGHPMGSVVPWPDRDAPRAIRVSIFGDAALAEAELLRGRDVVATHVGGSALINWTWRDDTPLAEAGTLYRVRARQTDGHWIFSSPIWLIPAQP